MEVFSFIPPLYYHSIGPAIDARCGGQGHKDGGWAGGGIESYWQEGFGAVGWQPLQQEEPMARKSRLTRVAVKIGAAMGKADRRAHKVAKAGALAKKELEGLAKQVDALKRQLQKSTKRLKRALA